MTAPLTVRDALGRPVSLGKEVAKGELTALYLVTRREGSVAKIWLDPLDKPLADKLLAAVHVRRTSLEDAAAWPTATLHDQAGKVIGYLMPQLNTADFRPLNVVYVPGESRGFFSRDWGFRLGVGNRVAQAFAALHDAGQSMGDVSERHVLVSSTGQVKLIGVDTYQINSEGTLHSARPSLLDLTPPELQAGGIAAQTRTPNHDNFGLAVMLFKLLFAGRHPYSGVPVGRPMPGPGEAIASDAFAYAESPKPYVQRPPGVPGLEVLPEHVRTLFERAFSPAHDNRPTAREWSDALQSMRSALVACEVRPNHLKVQGCPCPACITEAAEENKTADPVAESAGSSLAGALQRLWQQVQDVSPPDKPPPSAEVPDGPKLPPLPLNLPTKPRSLLSPDLQENILRWTLRILILAGLATLVYLIQKSVLAVVIEIGIVIFALTIGRRLSVDWDGLIDNFQNAEGRFVERLTPAQGQWQTYHANLEKRRDEIKRRFVDLRNEYKVLEDRYENENAYTAYQRDLLNLDVRRRKLLQGSGSQASALQSLIDEQSSHALSEYLKRQVIAPNVVPDLNARLALHLTTMGVRRASDVQGDKLKVVRPDLAEALTQWRSDLVNFFHFNPESIPKTQLEAAQRREQEQLNAEFRQFDRDVKAFVSTDWRSYSDDLVKKMQDTKAQAKQYQKALKQLDELIK